MFLTRHRQLTLLSLFALTTMAALVFASLRVKRQEAIAQRAINRTTFYDCVAKDQANVTGPPLATVVAMDTGEPVPGVIIGMTLIGPDGGDGGFHCYLTQEAGLACLHHPLTPGRYQYHLEPEPNSRFAPTEWRLDEPYIVVASDGTTTVPVLQLRVEAGG